MSSQSVGDDISVEAPCEGGTLMEAALKVLNTGGCWKKAEYGELAAKLWFEGRISKAYHHDHNFSVPDRPARHPIARLVAPQHMPKLGRAGNLQSRQALLHSLVHTESWAIDLSWDIIARFGKQESMPREFFDDFVKVAEEEGRHFKLLAARLKEIGSFYGALPVHDGLWESAEQTSKDLLGRLAIEHCVHEARGLDVLPTTISRFRKGGDDATADLLESVVYPEEITHCAAGLRWFKFTCQRSCVNSNITKNVDLLCAKVEAVNIFQKCNDDCTRTEFSFHERSPDKDDQKASLSSDGSDLIKDEFHGVVRKYFRGPLKPPFNEEARHAAGFEPEWYLPLAEKI